MANMLSAFNRSSAMKLPASSQEDTVVRKLRDMPWGDDDWSDAGLPAVLAYVYGAKGLVIPKIWQTCFPSTHFEHAGN